MNPPSDDVLAQLLRYLQLKEDEVGVKMVRQALVERATLRAKLLTTLSRLKRRDELIAELERITHA